MGPQSNSKNKEDLPCPLFYRLVKIFVFFLYGKIVWFYFRSELCDNVKNDIKPSNSSDGEDPMILLERLEWRWHGVTS